MSYKQRNWKKNASYDSNTLSTKKKYITTDTCAVQTTNIVNTDITVPYLLILDSMTHWLNLRHILWCLFQFLWNFCRQWLQEMQWRQKNSHLEEQQRSWIQLNPSNNQPFGSSGETSFWWLFYTSERFMLWR